MSEDANEHEAFVDELATLVERNRIENAKQVLSRALPSYPNSPAILLYAAWVEWVEERSEEALKHLDQALEIAPDFYNARRLRARILAAEERYVEAEQALLDLLKDFPEDPELLAMYARLMLSTFHVDKAEALAIEALKIDPDNDDALNVSVLCGFILHPGPEQRARLEKLLREHPDQVETSFRLIQALVDDGRVKEAYELSRSLVELYPNDEGIVDMAANLKQSSHWSMLPLYPMQKWGWAGSIGIWFIAIFLFRSDVLAGTPLEAHTNTIALIFIAYVVYSWVWPPLLRRLVR